MEEKEQYKEGDIVEEGPYAGFQIISMYTRSQAIADGVLVDVTTYAKSLGITLPVAITATLWGYVETDTIAEEAGETTASRLSDLLQMLKVGIRGMADNSDSLIFDVQFTRCGKLQVVTVKGICGPGDTAAPVITLMMPEED